MSLRLVIGAQHHLLAALLLLRYKPTSRGKPAPPQMTEEKRKVSSRGVESDLAYLTLYTQKICNIVREICAIGIGDNPLQATPPGMFTACMAIAVCKWHTTIHP